MKTLKRTLLGITMFAVTVQAIVAAINWNMTKNWAHGATPYAPMSAAPR